MIDSAALPLAYYEVISMNKGKYYLSTAIAYTSGKPHIGNTYEIVLADAICRFKRLNGYDVYFQTGTDEHGQKIQLKAEEQGVTPSSSSTTSLQRSSASGTL